MRGQLWLVGVMFVTLRCDTVFAMRGSRDVTSNDYPFMASIRLWPNNTHHCGGTIHSTRYILTSAGCVFGRGKEELAVFVGSNRLSQMIKYEIEEIKITEEYNPNSKVNNIALLKTTKEIVLQRDVVSLVQYERLNIPIVSSKLTMIGWTDPTEDPQNAKDELQVLQTTLRDREDCAPPQNVFKVNDRQICSTNFAGSGICGGDFGGPIFRNGWKLQLAIISHYDTSGNDLVCGNGKAEVFLTIPSMLWWIEANSH